MDGVETGAVHAARFVPELLKDEARRSATMCCCRWTSCWERVTGGDREPGGVCARGGRCWAIGRTWEAGGPVCAAGSRRFDDAVVRSIVGAASANASDWIVSTDKDWSKLRDRPAEVAWR